MKNLPDKIYLNFGEMTKEEFETNDYNEFCKLDEYAVTFSEDKMYDNDIEYIRKDAFIEKACEWLKENITNNPNANSLLVRNGCVTLGMLVDDFKNYMK